MYDMVIIFFSILIAVILTGSNILTTFLVSTGHNGIIGSFIAGIFFTSIFTTAPSIVALAEIAHTHSLVLTALFGALGAVVGDLIIFRFVRDRISSHVIKIVEHRKIGKKVSAFLHLKMFRWMTFLIGGLIIASPLPDELGISILGLSKVKVSWFIGLSFVFNFIGIFIIGFAAQAV